MTMREITSQPARVLVCGPHERSGLPRRLCIDVGSHVCSHRMFHGDGAYWRGRWDVELECECELELELEWKHRCIGIGRCRWRPRLSSGRRSLRPERSHERDNAVLLQREVRSEPANWKSAMLVNHPLEQMQVIRRVSNMRARLPFAVALFLSFARYGFARGGS